MPLPILFIGTALATGAFGASKTAKAVTDNKKAKNIILSANELVESCQAELERQREEVSFSLEMLGEEKVSVLNTTVKDFVSTFEKIKNIDFRDSEGLDEIKNLQIDKKEFEELKELGNFAAEVAGGATAGVAGGALTALGAYGAASALATASTGTAIATLSGAAATNATLAFFGGGSLAAGGLGVAGGMMVLGGLVAGPALAVMGLITGAKAEEKIEKAEASMAEAEEVAEALRTASAQCIAIRRRTNMLYNILAVLDSRFLPQVWKLEEVFNQEGDDYSKYSANAKKAVIAAATTAKSIKAVLDTPMLSPEGELTKESEMITTKMKELIYS